MQKCKLSTGLRKKADEVSQVSKANPIHNVSLCISTGLTGLEINDSQHGSMHQHFLLL